ncbi:MAG: DmsE family decaheme c-type cytochrome [Bacteroidota bacterium]
MSILRQLLAAVACVSLLNVGAAFAADAPKAKEAPKDLVLKGDAKCTGCHDEADDTKPTMLDLHPSVLSIARTRHGVKGDPRTPTCTDCHGESDKHIGYKGSDKPPKPDRWFSKNTDTPAADRNAACLTCHKGDKRTRWEGSQHAVNDVACTTCHKVHAEHDKVREKKTQAEVCFTCHQSERAQTHKISTHPLAAGKMMCSDCHNLHGSAGPKLLKKNTLNETCFMCHAEKRGPFLFEHRPAVEDCSNCHMPHGSNLTPLLKSRPPFMCQECHDGTHASATPVGPNVGGFQAGLSRTNPSGTAQFPSTNNVGSACMNCHRQVHGSNSPAGGYFQR